MADFADFERMVAQAEAERVAQSSVGRRMIAEQQAAMQQQQERNRFDDGGQLDMIFAGIERERKKAAMRDKVDRFMGYLQERERARRQPMVLFALGGNTNDDDDDVTSEVEYWLKRGESEKALNAINRRKRAKAASDHIARLMPKQRRKNRYDGGGEMPYSKTFETPEEYSQYLTYLRDYGDEANRYDYSIEGVNSNYRAYNINDAINNVSREKVGNDGKFVTPITVHSAEPFPTDYNPDHSVVITPKQEEIKRINEFIKAFPKEMRNSFYDYTHTSKPYNVDISQYEQMNRFLNLYEAAGKPDLYQNTEHHIWPERPHYSWPRFDNSITLSVDDEQTFFPIYKLRIILRN